MSRICDRRIVLDLSKKECSVAIATIKLCMMFEFFDTVVNYMFEMCELGLSVILNWLKGF